MIVGSASIQKRNEMLCFVFASFVPFLFTSLWMFSNTQLPASDATDYLGTAYRMYHHFVYDGFWSGLSHLVIEKGWRPIFFPLFCVPFLLLSHGNVMFAYNAVAALSVLIGVIYVYLLLRLWLDRFSAIVAANLIGFLPFVQVPVFAFTSECILFPTIIGTLYHLIQSDYFRNKHHSLGFIICLSLALVVRPVEAATDLFFVFVVFLFSGGYRKVFSLKQIVTVTSMGLLTLFLLLFSIAAYFIHHYPLHPIDGGVYDIKFAKILYRSLVIVLVGLLMTGAALIIMNVVPWFRRKCQVDGEEWSGPPVITVFGFIFVVVLMWFLPHSFETYVWIFQTSLGPVADVTAQSLTKQAAWAMIYSFIVQESIVTVAGISLVTLLGFMTVKKKKIREIITSSSFIYLLSLLPFPVWEVLNTCQTEARKFGLAFSGLLMALLLIGLQRGKWWALRVFIVAVLLIVQLVYAFGVIDPRLQQIKTFAALLGKYPRPVTVQPNPHDVVIRFLNEQAKEYQLNNIVIAVSWEKALPIYPYLLMMQSKIANYSYHLSYPFFSSYSDEISQQLSTDNDAVFLTDKQSDMVVSDIAAKAYYNRYINAVNPALKNLYHFLNYYSQNKLNNIGWKLGPCITMKASDNNNYLGCLLISLKKPLITAHT